MIKQAFKRFWNDERGNVLLIAGVAAPALLGILGLAVEGAGWYQVKNSLQNAADSAAVAAATNGTSTYGNEAKAVTASYGYTHGTENVVVTSSNTATCPSGGNNCYSVTITKPIPLFMSQIVGFTGNTTYNNAPATSLRATAIATQITNPRSYCILALATSGDAVAFETNGAPKADLTGCNIMSNTGMTCNGHNLGAGYGDAAGVNSGCGINQTSSVPRLTDPYSALASNIPANTCTSYPQKPAGNGNNAGTPLPASNLLSGTKTWTGNQQFCGDVQLTGNVTLTGTETTVVINNGQLDTNGYTFKTATGAAATIIFSGTNAAGYTHTPTGGGTIDIRAPTSGTWSGVAIYQDPAITNGVNISEAGNSPTWNITGLTYLPRSSVIFSGAVNKSSAGVSCFVMVVDNLLINGTGSILAYGDCAAAGLTLPVNPMPVRGRLVA